MTAPTPQTTEAVQRLIDQAERCVQDAQALAAEVRSARDEAAASARSAADASRSASESARTTRDCADKATREAVDSAERLRRSFQTLWVGGTLGALFAALAATIPDAYRRYGTPVSYEATLDLSLRYGYLLWLLAYFFISNLLNEDDRRCDAWDVWFDVIQSAGALIAAWLLGFLSPSDGFTTQPLTRALIGTNVVIFVICALSYRLFHRDDTARVNTLRVAGLVVTLLTLAVLWCARLQTRLVAGASAFSWLVLTALLIVYVVRRVHSLGKTPPVRAPGGPSA